MGSRRPSIQWYPSDWRKDLNVQSCSIGARGLWAEMLWLMHEGEPYGHLKVGGKALKNSEIASLCRVKGKLFGRLLGELEDACVFSRDADLAIYCRRMVRDHLTKKKRVMAGKLGGNPNLLLNQEDNQQVNHEVKRMVEEEDEVEEHSPSTKTETKEVEVDIKDVCSYVSVKERWNETISHVKMRNIAGKRQSNIRALWREGGPDLVFEVIDKVAASAFLTSQGWSGRGCDCSWPFEPGNTAKILEGRYDDVSMRRSTGDSVTDEWMEQNFK